MHPTDQFVGLELNHNEKIYRFDEIENFSSLGGLRASKTVKDILILTDSRILCAQRSSILRGAGKYLAAGFGVSLVGHVGYAVGSSLLSTATDKITKKPYSPKVIKIKNISWEAKYSDVQSLSERRQGFSSVFSFEIRNRNPLKFMLTGVGFGRKPFLQLLADKNVKIDPVKSDGRLAQAVDAMKTAYPLQIDSCTSLTGIAYTDAKIKYCYIVNFKAGSPEALSHSKNQRAALVGAMQKDNDGIFNLLSGYTITYQYNYANSDIVLSITLTADDLI